MKKRLFTRGIALGLAAVMLAGCSGSGTSTSQGSTDAGTTGQSAETQASQGQEQTTIEMWYHISPDQATLLLQMIDEFQAPLNCALNALILALNDSASALVALLSKKLIISR